MNRIAVLLFATVLLSSVGCLGLRPVGVMADSLQPRESAAAKPDPGAKVTAAKDARPRRPRPRPSGCRRAR